MPREQQTTLIKLRRFIEWTSELTWSHIDTCAKLESVKWRWKRKNLRFAIKSRSCIISDRRKCHSKSANHSIRLMRLHRDHCLRMSWAFVTFFVCCEIPSDSGMKQWCEIVFVLVNIACHAALFHYSDAYESKQQQTEDTFDQISGWRTSPALHPNVSHQINLKNSMVRSEIVRSIWWNGGNWQIHAHAIKSMAIWKMLLISLTVYCF